MDLKGCLLSTSSFGNILPSTDHFQPLGQPTPSGQEKEIERVGLAGYLTVNPEQKYVSRVRGKKKIWTVAR